MKLSIIAAIASGNRALGKDNKLIYHISNDLKRFKKLTSGHVIIMGRKTFESIGKPLPGRTNIVITHESNYSAEGCVVVHSLDEAIKTAQSQPGNDEIFIIGGGQIYQEAIGLVDKLYLTYIDKEIEGDVFFPDYSQFKKMVKESNWYEHEGMRYKFLELEK